MAITADLTNCPACEAKVTKDKEGNVVPLFTVSFCHECERHRPQLPSSKVFARYLELKRAWIKKHGIPLDDNFGGEIRPLCGTCKGRHATGRGPLGEIVPLCQDCQGTGRDQSQKYTDLENLLREAEETLPEVAKKEVGEDPPPAPRPALHIVCRVCGYVRIEERAGL